MSEQIDAIAFFGLGASSLDRALAQAMAHHEAWEFDEAEDGYREVLRASPRHADANHNLGVLKAVQLLQPLDALPFLEAALDAEPQRAQFWLSYVDALTKSGLFDAAQQALTLARLQGLEESTINRLSEDLSASQLPVPVVKGVHWSAPAAKHAPATARPAPSAPKKGVVGPSAKEAQDVVALFNRGEHARGERLALALAKRYPAAGTVWKILGALQQQLGKHDEALQAKRKAAELLPDDAEAHCNLGNTLVSAGLAAEAIGCFERAVALRSGYAQAHFNHGNALLALSLFGQAEAQFRLAREISPGWADAHSNLGFSLKEQHRLAEAAESYSHALAVAPGDPTTLTNLGLIQDAMGLGEEALRCFQQALSKRPDDSGAHGAYGAALHKLGKLSLAENAYRKALRLEPDSLPAFKRLGLLLQQQGRLKEAETCLRRCLIAQPELASAHFDLGTNLIEQKKWDEAEAMLQAALVLKPDYVEAHINLSKVLYERGDFDRAIATVKESLEILPNVPSLHTNLGVSYTMQGFVDEAIACYRRALAIDPDFNYARSCMLYALSHSTKVDVDTLTREHHAFGERALASVAGKIHTEHANDIDPDRPLRVAFVSADLREHAVAKFFTPFIEGFAKRKEFTRYAYYNHAARDRATQAIQQHFDVWRPVVGLSDERLAAQIREDGIDILIDMSGHTAGNRLVMFARHPAPVQATWGGYPGTTGLAAMDYRFVEHFFLESDGFERQFVEKFLQLPAVSPFHGMEAMPDVGEAPCAANGFLTFGSFNRLSKINRDVVAAWCQVLRALPDARLVMAAMPTVGAPPQLREWFDAEGIAAHRVSYHARTHFYDYLRLHAQVDLCLDTFPYTGGTTTNHALWMGVPTLTIAGDIYASRQSAVFLYRVGLHRSCVAKSVGEMVEQAQEWAARPDGLRRVRAGLRPHLQQMHATQLDVVVAGVSRALRRIWQRWCAGQAPEGMVVQYEEIGMKRQPPLEQENLA